MVSTHFDEENWRIPFEEVAKYTPQELLEKHLIALDPRQDEEGSLVRGLAVEGDWHDIPSLRKLVRGDVKIVASKVKFIVDHGAFVTLKEAFKKVLPHEYEMLHELKDILTARNLLQNI